MSARAGARLRLRRLPGQPGELLGVWLDHPIHARVAWPRSQAVPNALRRTLAALAVSLFIAASPSLAQTGVTGTAIGGTVRDATGALLPKSRDHGDRSRHEPDRTTTTDDRGALSARGPSPRVLPPPGGTCGFSDARAATACRPPWARFSSSTSRSAGGDGDGVRRARRSRAASPGRGRGLGRGLARPRGATRRTAVISSPSRC